MVGVYWVGILGSHGGANKGIIADLIRLVLK